MVVNVTVPAKAAAGNYTVNITASSLKGGLSTSVPAKVNVPSIVGVRLESSDESLTLLPAEYGAFVLDVDNLGNVDDIVTLSAKGVPDGWSLDIDTKKLDLGPYASGRSDVTIIPSAEALAGDYPITFKARSDVSRRPSSAIVWLPGFGTTSSGEPVNRRSR